MPDGPPFSPLTGSYFTTWAFFDLRFGPDDETIGTCLLDVGERLGLGPEVIEAIRLMSETRMGVYEHAGLKGGRCLLRELITDDEFECYCPAGYLGSPGELWFVRLCPPIEPADYHVAFTTPYILMGFGKADWTAYLSKSLIGLTAPEKRRRLHGLLKYGREPNYWSEFIFKAYHHPSARRHLPDGAARRAGEHAPRIGGHGSGRHALSLGRTGDGTCDPSTVWVALGGSSGGMDRISASIGVRRMALRVFTSFPCHPATQSSRTTGRTDRPCRPCLHRSPPDTGTRNRRKLQ